MKSLLVRLENCHGVAALNHDFSFADQNAVAIYAPNGTMKTSLARTFADLSRGEDSKDHVFPDRVCVREIVDDSGTEPTADAVAVFLAYDEGYASNDYATTLLVNPKLRSEYEQIQQGLTAIRDRLAKALKATARTREDVGALVSRLFAQQDDRFFEALVRARYGVENQLDDPPPFADVPHDVIFNSYVLKVVENAEFQAVLTEYVTRLNELLDQSTFFDRATFGYYNAETVSKTLAKQGYFDAKHSLVLSGETEPRTVSSESELEALITEEKQRITDDPALKKRLDALEKAINANEATRAFLKLISARPELLVHLGNVELFQQEVWKSYFKVHQEVFLEAVDTYVASEDRRKAIERQAASERTQWEEVIDEFNTRFHVPFTLVARNKERVVLDDSAALILDFEFNDGRSQTRVDREHLLRVLSNGEKKALYILNILFEVKARRAEGKHSLFVIDDIADSFDYKNKYAIIHYLKEMAVEPVFRLIILTHNFDFLRTIHSRGVVRDGYCYIAEKHADRVNLLPLDKSTVTNPFTQDFKKQLFSDGMKRVASIPFVRNLIEYTRGTEDADYQTLTALVHVRPETATITNQDLDRIFKGTVASIGDGSWAEPASSVVELILAEADNALESSDSMNLANKIVLSMAIRLVVETYMIAALADPEFTDKINRHQTSRLVSAMRKRQLGDSSVYATLDRVQLMTPENIHVNSFMYEPIIDMSDAALRGLYAEVKSLNVGAQDTSPTDPVAA